MFYNGIKEFNEIKTNIISGFADVTYKPDFIFFALISTEHQSIYAKTLWMFTLPNSLKFF